MITAATSSLHALKTATYYDISSEHSAAMAHEIMSTVRDKYYQQDKNIFQIASETGLNIPIGLTFPATFFVRGCLKTMIN